VADNALYWAGRCYQLHGQTRQAISKFYEIGTRYPKSEKAPAALWAQGNLFIAMGNSGDARLVLSEIIRKYPSSPQAGLARQKLTEIER
jgi:TolA-binding protein